VLRIRKLSKSEISNITKRTPFLCLLLSCGAFITPAYGMDGGSDWSDQGWNKLFYKPHHGTLLGPHILGFLDDRSLGRSTQVSRGWNASVHKSYDAKYALRCKGKEPLFAAIIDAVGAEPDEVGRAWHTLNALVKSPDFQSKASPAIKKKLASLQDRLLQPESLILRDEKDRFLSCPQPYKAHPALASLVQVIAELQDLQEDVQFKELKPENAQVFFALKSHYEDYLEKLLHPETDRVALLHPKAILSGEGFIDFHPGMNPGNKPENHPSLRLHDLYSSYRISQEMACSLLSKDRYGLLLKSNTSGSHAVKHQGQIHFKGNTTTTGLPVGMESAAYWFAQVLFGRGMTPSALLSLNEVEIKTPPQDTAARSAYALAQVEGKTSGDFFRHYPQHQEAFTERNPHHVIQANLHVEGISLEDFMKGAVTGQYDYNDLDLNSFSELIFISLLTNPSDGTPGNFMVSMGHGKPYSIVGIDNDMAFGPSVIATKMGRDQSKKDIFKPSLEVKNVLYCLPLMGQPLSPETRDKILSTCPELFLLRWLERLKLQQQHYDKLKDQENGYAKDNKGVPHLTEALYTGELHLPLQLPCGLVTTLLNDFTKLQGKIRSRPAITHTQLFSFLQPLAHRFYEALKRQYSTPLSAYQYIHNSHHEQIYLEDILAPHALEVLTSGQTITQALREFPPLHQTQKITQNQDEKHPSTQSLDEGAQEIWKDLDLNKYSRIAPFLELAANTFPMCFQGKTSFHHSWLQNSLLFRALDERVSENALSFLIHHLKPNISVRDSRTQQNAFHYAIKKQYPHNILSLFLNSLPFEEKMSLLNGVDHQGLTPLDHAMEQDDSHAFITLRNLGTATCSASIALKFYKRKVREDDALHSAFKELMDLNPEIGWRVSLEELLPPLTPGENHQGLPLATLTLSTYGERQLPDDIKNQILNPKGEFIQISNTGNHPVAYAQKKGPLKTHSLYFKLYPALPGLEEAVGSLTRQLLGFGAPYTDLVKLGSLPCLISQEIPGDTLLRVLDTKPTLLTQLDEEDISGMLIAAMLTNPEDGKPDNYVVTPHPTKENSYRIVGIDNDQAFVPAIVKEQPDKEYWTGKLLPIAQVKTILYCLNQMKDPLRPNIRQIIINTHPDRFLEEWLRWLKRVNNQYCGLFTNSQQNEFFKNHESFVGVPFQAGAIKHLYEKFVTLRDLVTDNPTLTHMDLLNKLEPRLAKRYEEALNKDISVKERFKEVDRPFYEVKTDKQKGESHTTVTQSGNILQSMGIPLKEEIFNSIRLGKENAPDQALQELEVIKKEKSEGTLKSLTARVGDVHLLKTLTLESSRVLFLKELEKQKKILTPQEQTAILDYLSTQKNIRELILPNFSAMDDVLFQRLSFEHLRNVDLRGCHKITYRGLVRLSQTTLGLEELNLSFITQLKEIGDIGLWDAPLTFKELRFLNLSNCINLNKLLLQAPKLHYLNIANCALLTDQMLDGVIEHTPSLQKLAFEGCSLIGEREMREKYPNFPVSYCGEKKTPIIKILEHRQKRLTFEAYKIDTSSQGIKAFARALKINANLKNLTSLDLGKNDIGDEGAKSLASGRLISLKTLYLGYNSIGDEGTQALASGNLTALTCLNLESNNIGDEATQAIASGNLTALTKLNLVYNDIGAAGAKALASGKLTALEMLDLQVNRIGTEGAKALASGNLTSLTGLNLGHNDIRDTGSKALTFGNLAALTELALGRNNIRDEGVKAFASGNLTALTKLDLVFNDIGAGGAKAIAEGNLTALTSLDLGYNNIGDYGAQGLALGNFTALTSLHLCESNIGDAGAKALEKAYFPALTELNLWKNNIRDTAKEALKKRYPNTKIHF
jgi:Leucine-rich repeat (LRR) protein